MPKLEKKKFDVWILLTNFRVLNQFKFGNAYFHPDHHRKESAMEQVEDCVYGWAELEITAVDETEAIELAEVSASEHAAALTLLKHIEKGQVLPRKAIILGYSTLEGSKIAHVVDGVNQSTYSSTSFRRNMLSPVEIGADEVKKWQELPSCQEIERLVTKRNRTKLENKVLGAIGFYSEAILAKGVDKILKVIIGLETLIATNTDKHESISTNISEKIAFLLSDKPTQRKEWRQKAKTLYSMRSNYVHAGILPDELEIDYLVEHLLGAAIISFISLKATEGLFKTAAEIDDWYVNKKMS